MIDAEIKTLGAPMWNFLTSTFSREVLGSKSVTLAFVALVIAVLVASVTYFIFSFAGGEAGKNSKALFETIPVTLQLLVFGVFLLAFVAVWFMLYVQYVREAEDIYSRLREKLTGSWQVKYELYPGQNRNPAFDYVPSIVCDVAVNEATKKLEIHFDIKDHPLFEDGKQIIQTIALRHESENRYSMSYYYKMARGLNPLLATHILKDDTDEKQTDLLVEIFATLIFEDVKPKEKVKLIKGEWFDLNGNLIRLFSLVSEIKEHQDPDSDRIFRKKLSDAEITRDNFAALMGEINFSRS
jgi:hypothetical protein